MTNSISDFKNFQAWIVGTGRGYGIATLYTSFIRNAVRHLGPNPTAPDLLEYHAMLPKQRRAQFRASWRAFNEYAKAKGKIIACPPFPVGRNVKTNTAATQILQNVIPKLLEAGFTADELSTLRVKNVSGRGDDIAIVKADSGRVAEFPRPLIQQLVEYAIPGYGKDPKIYVDRFWFLFAEKPPGLVPMTPERIEDFAEAAARSSYESKIFDVASKTGSSGDGGGGSGSSDAPDWW